MTQSTSSCSRTASAAFRRSGAGRWAALAAVLALFLAVPSACTWGRPDDAELWRQVDAMYDSYRVRNFPDVAEISPQDAMALAGRDPGKVVFIDVRPDEERRVSTIPGSVRADVFLANVEQYRGMLGVAFCTISYRSGELLEELGGELDGVRLANLQGGLLGWVHAGGALVDDRGEPVKRLHVFGSRWDLAPQGYETVW